MDKNICEKRANSDRWLKAGLSLIMRATAGMIETISWKGVQPGCGNSLTEISEIVMETFTLATAIGLNMKVLFVLTA